MLGRTGMRARIGAVTASLARRSLAVVLVSLSALCCAAGSHPAQPPREPGREEWLELETPHFSIYTDLTELPARHMAQSLEDARAALLAGAWPGAKGPPGRT